MFLRLDPKIRYHLIHYSSGLSKQERVAHGVTHHTRVMFYIVPLHTLYVHCEKLAAKFLNETDLELIKFAALFHDTGREDDGEDRPEWEEISGKNAYDFLRSKGYSETDAKFCQDVIVDKDAHDTDHGNSTTITSNKLMACAQLLHDADCLDILRARNEFHPWRLYIYKYFLAKKYELNKFKLLTRVIQSASALIDLHGDTYQYPNKVKKSQFNKDNCTELTRQHISSHPGLILLKSLTAGKIVKYPQTDGPSRTSGSTLTGLAEITAEELTEEIIEEPGISTILVRAIPRDKENLELKRRKGKKLPDKIKEELSHLKQGNERRSFTLLGPRVQPLYEGVGLLVRAQTSEIASVSLSDAGTAHGEKQSFQCRSQEENKRALEELYNEIWKGYIQISRGREKGEILENNEIVLKRMTSENVIALSICTRGDDIPPEHYLRAFYTQGLYLAIFKSNLKIFIISTQYFTVNELNLGGLSLDDFILEKATNYVDAVLTKYKIDNLEDLINMSSCVEYDFGILDRLANVTVTKTLMKRIIALKDEKISKKITSFVEDILDKLSVTPQTTNEPYFSDTGALNCLDRHIRSTLQFFTYIPCPISKKVSKQVGKMICDLLVYLKDKLIKDSKHRVFCQKKIIAGLIGTSNRLDNDSKAAIQQAFKAYKDAQFGIERNHFNTDHGKTDYAQFLFDRYTLYRQVIGASYTEECDAISAKAITEVVKNYIPDPCKYFSNISLITNLIRVLCELQTENYKELALKVADSFLKLNYCERLDGSHYDFYSYAILIESFTHGIKLMMTAKATQTEQETYVTRFIENSADYISKRETYSLLPEFCRLLTIAEAHVSKEKRPILDYKTTDKILAQIASYIVTPLDYETFGKQLTELVKSVNRLRDYLPNETYTGEQQSIIVKKFKDIFNNDANPFKKEDSPKMDQYFVGTILLKYLRLSTEHDFLGELFTLDELISYQKKLNEKIDSLPKPVALIYQEAQSHLRTLCPASCVPSPHCSVDICERPLGLV